MIDDKLLERFNTPTLDDWKQSKIYYKPIKEENLAEVLWCKQYLLNSDFEVIKHAEGREVEDYEQVLSSRQWARERINELSEEE